MSESLQPGLIAISTVFLVLSVFIVALRCWTGYVTASHKFGYDDWFAAATIPFIIIQTALVYQCISLGLGTPFDTLPQEDVETIRRLLFVSSFFFNTAIVLPKISALAFYNRIFGRTVRWFHYSLWALAIANVAWLIAAYFLLGFQCRPVTALWTTSDGEPDCVPQWEWLTGLAAPSTVIDLIILILPMRLLWGIQASMQRKVIMTAVFAAGYCAFIVSLGRLITLAAGGDSNFSDPTYSSVHYLEWVQCEAPVSVISVSLPNIFTLFRRMQEHGTAFIFTGRPSPTNPPPLPPKSPGQLLSPSALLTPNVMFSPTAEKARGDTWFDNASISTSSTGQKSRSKKERRGRVGNSRLDSYPTRLSLAARTVEYSDAKTVAFSIPGPPIALTLPPKTKIFSPRSHTRTKSSPRVPLLAALSSPYSPQTPFRDEPSPSSPTIQNNNKRRSISVSMNHIVSQARRTFMGLSPRLDGPESVPDLPALPSTPDLLPRSPTALAQPTVPPIPELPETGLVELPERRSQGAPPTPKWKTRLAGNKADDVVTEQTVHAKVGGWGLVSPRWPKSPRAIQTAWALRSHPTLPPAREGRVREASVREPSVREPSVRSPAPPSPSIRSPSVRSPSIRSPAPRSPHSHSPAPPSPSIRSPAPQSPSIRPPSIRSPAPPTPTQPPRHKITIPPPLHSPVSPLPYTPTPASFAGPLSPLPPISPSPVPNAWLASPTMGDGGVVSGNGTGGVLEAARGAGGYFAFGFREDREGVGWDMGERV